MVYVTEITERIAARMRELKLEPIDLAAGARTSQTTVERWINHYSDPRAYKIVAIANTLKVSVSWLLTGEEEAFDEQTRASIWEGLQGALDRLAALRQKKMTETVRAEIDEVEQGITLAQQLLGLTKSTLPAKTRPSSKKTILRRVHLPEQFGQASYLPRMRRLIHLDLPSSFAAENGLNRPYRTLAQG